MFKVKGNGLRDYFIVVKTSINLRKLCIQFPSCTLYVLSNGLKIKAHFKIFLSKQLSLKLKPTVYNIPKRFLDHQPSYLYISINR